MGTFYFLNRYGVIRSSLLRTLLGRVFDTRLLAEEFFIYQSSEPFLLGHFTYSSINCK